MLICLIYYSISFIKINIKFVIYKKKSSSMKNIPLLFSSHNVMNPFCEFICFICDCCSRCESGGDRKYVFGLPVRHMAPFGADGAVFGFQRSFDII